MLFKSLALLGGLSGALALGERRVISFPDFAQGELDIDQSQTSWTAPKHHKDGFILASKHHQYAAPILTSSKDDVAVHIAVATFADDIERVTGVKPGLYNDTLPAGSKTALVVGSYGSDIVHGIAGEGYDELKGKWESYDIRVKDPSIKGVDEALVIAGSDRRGTIYGLYTLSEQMGVSPWHFWSDVPVRHQPAVSFDKTTPLSHGEPTVKYRGLFINDEHPALWGWAQQYFELEAWEAAFQTQFYRPWFEMMLRLKANYHWPAMYDSMFSVDGLPNIPDKPIPGPNLELATDMGIVMGTSHHEPIGRNKREWDIVKTGPWDWTNKEVLIKHWTYGAERARGKDVLYTMGMRGDGDEPLSGASIALVENITSTQLDILDSVHGKEVAKSIPKMWAMYKEVADYYADGLNVPDDVSVLFADDNWGNLMQVMSPAKTHASGAGIYYHVDYVGLPRAYKWINTINLAKTWEQLNIARSFNTTQIWIVNVGSLKPLEMPSEHFLSLAYDFDQWDRNSARRFLREWAAREFGQETKDEIADIMMLYSRYASRSKPELLNSTIWSLNNYDEAERIQHEWDTLAARAGKVHSHLPKDTQPAFFQLVYMLCEMQANINRLYIAVGKSNLFAEQSRNAANDHAHAAIEAFKNDARLTQKFHSLNDGRWDHMLDQTHIGWKNWLEVDRDILPPVSFVNPHQPVLRGIPIVELEQPGVYSTRITVENSHGAWPGRAPGNCGMTAKCPDPTLFTMDPYGAQTRYIDISAGGPRNVDFKVEVDVDWLKVSQTHGKIKRNASTDQRIYVSVDWAKFGENAREDEGHVTIRSTDTANVTVTVPVVRPGKVDADFKGFVQGDGYIVMEAAHHSGSKAVDAYEWQEIEGYGRTLSGMEMFPVSMVNFTVGTGPSLSYDIWTHQSGPAVLNFQIGPTLNFLAGKQISFGVEVDGSNTVEIQPVTMERLGGVEVLPGQEIFVGAVPPDWENVVKSDIRNVTLGVDFAQAGKHTIKVFGMSSGVVLERIWVDFGGIKERGYSYLGPPESYRQE